MIAIVLLLIVDRRSIDRSIRILEKLEERKRKRYIYRLIFFVHVCRVSLLH